MVESPCKNICSRDPESGLCIGCGRTEEEITKWVTYSEEQKKIVLTELEKRY